MTVLWNDASLFQQHTGWLVIRVLVDEFTHDGKLKDGLFELVDAVFGGEQGVEVVCDAVPSLGQLQL